MKTMKYLISIFFIAGVLFTSCDVDYLNSPNEPETAPTYGLMNRVQKRFMDDTRDEWFSGRQMLLWVQYWNQVNYTEEDRFQYRETTNQGAWNDIYGNAQDLIDIIEFNDPNSPRYESSMAAYGDPEAQIAAARTMLVFVYLNAVELWGNVPYYSYGSSNTSFQANKLRSDNNFAPAYASQQDIYVDMLNVLDEAQKVFADPTITKVIDGDNFYNGDPAKWRKFANSLRLRIANRIKDVYSPAQQIITNAINDGVFTSNDDNAGVTYESIDLNASPMYRAFYVSNRTDFAPSYSFVELLKGDTTDFYNNPFSKDPRLDLYVADNDDGYKLGIPLADGNDAVRSFSWASLPGAGVLKPDYTEIYMEYAEVCFIQSEINGWDQDWYEKGVRASMERWGVPTADIDAYIATLPAANEETVLMQKYIALYMQPMEAWSEYRRTGYPVNLVKPNVQYTYNWSFVNDKDVLTDTSATYTFVPIGDLTDIPTRNRYLLNEQNINSANYEAAKAAMGGDDQKVKLWWAK